MRVLVSGASGFVGRSLVSSLIDAKLDVIALVRERSLFLPKEVVQVVVGDFKAWSAMNLSFNSKIKKILPDVDVVIHLASRVHIMADNSSDPLAEFRVINTDATLALASAAVGACVNRFIYISSIGVNGNKSFQPFTEQCKPEPHNHYAISKHEAENGLLTLASDSNMKVVIIRPPLVYGPNAPGNFATLIKWIYKGPPLPFGAIDNLRSFVALENLVSFIIHCLDHPKAANEVFLISDGEDVSTTKLLQKVAKALGKKPSLIPVPVSWMNFVVKLVGKGDVSTRLFCSLQVDSTKARDLLGWKPVITMDAQLKKTADAYLENEKTL
ncbi:MAG: nucleoside-diphosphate-sugar epimerase [Francisellaceae bacterium]|jgi:nucleoside-diphosphate-sugar epimerase